MRNNDKILSNPEWKPVTPLADAIIKLRNKTNYSFHALPIFGGASVSECNLGMKYREIFGERMCNAEMTVVGKEFDSFFFPETVIKESEQLAAELFGADGTLFVTTGTTTSNQIAIHALCNNNSKVLLDKSCHQSMHFTLNTLGARIDYISHTVSCENSDRSYWDLEELVQMALTAQQQGCPYQLIVLNAQSYDGVIYDIPGIISYLLNNGVVTRSFLIDEAWGSANYFHKSLFQYAATNITPLLHQFPDLWVVATQSAHKSLSCLRQASLIHFRGTEELLKRLQCARFRIHTTSPSYPILASIDLARAQMKMSGTTLLERTTALAESFCAQVQTDENLSSYTINSFKFPRAPFTYASADPTKVSLNISGLDTPASELKDLLYSKYGIYISRVTNDSILLNFHIGISSDAVNKLLDALRNIQSDNASRWTESAAASDSYVIPYPPGVPLIVPGEHVTPLIRKKLNTIKRAGTRIFII